MVWNLFHCFSMSDLSTEINISIWISWILAHSGSASSQCPFGSCGNCCPCQHSFIDLYVFHVLAHVFLSSFHGKAYCKSMFAYKQITPIAICHCWEWIHTVMRPWAIAVLSSVPWHWVPLFSFEEWGATAVDSDQRVCYTYITCALGAIMQCCWAMWHRCTWLAC